MCRCWRLMTLGEKVLLLVLTIVIVLLIGIFAAGRTGFTCLNSKTNTKFYLDDDLETRYIGALIMQLDRENFICHVTFIDEYWSVTTSRCIEYLRMDVHRNLMPRWFIKTRYNIWDMEGTLHEIKLSIIHPNYDNKTLKNNIGLIKSNTKLISNERLNFLHIGRIDPWLTFFNVTTNSSKSEIIAEGWSKLTYNVDSPGSFVKMGDLQLVNSDDCKNYWKTIQDVGNESKCIMIMSESQICIPGEASPLVYGDILLGVNSWGEKCEFNKFPQVYTNVYPYKEWIHSKMKQYSK